MTSGLSVKVPIKCPKCNSPEVSKSRISPRAFAFCILLLGFPLPFMSRTHHCFDCGHDFRNKRHQR